ncbi:hypothetical protein NLJ89_g11214 [Agrocybe chaxingu]|uniref:Uncharacterized protein n=1 Tax=Agrocybe chaxingu TaxID=84603 RepID=A0A9W8MRD1_9AGAR|nr:hypothetical protein NLJ89_g11214 [Agrocybe chaxingu]
MSSPLSTPRRPRALDAYRAQLRPKKAKPPPPAPLSSPLPPLTEAEIAALRKDKYGLPCAIDQWLRPALVNTVLPTNIPGHHVQAPSLDYLLVNDVVECFVTLGARHRICKHRMVSLSVQVRCCAPSVKVQKEEPNEDSFFVWKYPIFSLELSVTLPPESGFDSYFQQGPTVIMATYEGGVDHLDCPEWLEMVAPEGNKFFQPRTLMVEVIATIARRVRNQTAQKTLDWCKSVSRVTLDAVKKKKELPPFSIILRPRKSRAPSAVAPHKRAPKKTAKIIPNEVDMVKSRSIRLRYNQMTGSLRRRRSSHF